MKSLLNDADRAEVLERISRIRHDTPRRWGRMTPHGAVCHLTDAFLACVGDRPVEDRSTPLWRTLVRFLAMSTPVPWPRGATAPPEVDQEKGGTPPAEFAADLERLLASADDFVERLDPATMWHPLFGRLSRAEWGRWGYRHLDHHARQFGL